MNDMKNIDNALRRVLQPGPEQRSPAGFAESVMDKVRSEPLRETQGIRGWLLEYLPYAAAIVAAIAIALGWQFIPWPSGITANTSQEAGETIMQYRLMLTGFRDILNFLSSSSISLTFIFSVGLFIAADRLFNHFNAHRRTGNLRMMI